MEFKDIIIATVPGQAVTVTVAAGATLADALAEYKNISGIDAAAYTVRIGTVDAEMTVVPANGTRVYLLKKVKGNN